MSVKSSDLLNSGVPSPLYHDAEDGAEMDGAVSLFDEGLSSYDPFNQDSQNSLSHSKDLTIHIGENFFTWMNNGGMTFSLDEKGSTKKGYAKDFEKEIKACVRQLTNSSQIDLLLKALEKNDQPVFKNVLTQHYQELAEKSKTSGNIVSFYNYQTLARKIDQAPLQETFATFVRLQQYQNLFNRHDQFLTLIIEGLNEKFELGTNQRDTQKIESIRQKLEQLHQVSCELLEQYASISSELDDTFAIYRGNFAHKYRVMDEFLNRMETETVHTFGELPLGPGLKGKVCKIENAASANGPKIELENKRQIILEKLKQPNLESLEKVRLESQIMALDRSIADLVKVAQIKSENNFVKPLSPLDKKTVLIATCSFGTGHKQAAQALKSHIGDAANVTIMDPTDDDTGIFVKDFDWVNKLGKMAGKKWSSVQAFNWILKEQKYWMVNLENNVDGALCKIFNKKKNGVAESARGVETKLKNLLRLHLLMERPDLITTTYHMHLNPFLEVAEELGIPLTHVPTDFDVKMNEVFGNKSPEYSHFKTFLPDANARTLQTAAHLDRDMCHFLKTSENESLQVTGIALRPEFYIQRTQEEINQIKKENGIDPEATVVLVLSGGNGQELPYPEMLLNSKENGKKYHMIVVAGGNKDAGNHLNEKRKLGNRFITGKNPNVTVEVAEDPAIASEKQPYYLSASELSRLQAIADVAITKPGGLSIGELLQTGVPMIPDRRTTPMAWEDFNIEVIQSEKRGRAYTGKEEFLNLLDEVAAFGKKPKSNHSKGFTQEMSKMIDDVENESDEVMINRRNYRKDPMAVNHASHPSPSVHSDIAKKEGQTPQASDENRPSNLQILKTMAAFPLRYAGGKTWSIPGIIVRTRNLPFHQIHSKEPISQTKLFGSGYHFDNGQQLSKEETKKVLRYAAYGLVPFRYEHEKWAEPFGAKVVSPKDLHLDLKNIPGNIEATESAFIDKEHFFKAMVLEDENELVVTFGPLHSHWHDYSDAKIAKDKLNRQYLSIMSNYAGGVPQSYQQADALIKELKIIAERKNKKIVVTGQSLAGSIASYVSLKNEIEGICFNSVQLGAGLQSEIGDKKLAKADQYLTQVTITGDIVSHLPGLEAVDRTLTAAGIRTPGNFGNRYTVPSAFDSMRSSHDYPIKSLMAYIGYDKDTKADQLKDEDVIKAKQIG